MKRGKIYAVATLSAACLLMSACAIGGKGGAEIGKKIAFVHSPGAGQGDGDITSAWTGIYNFATKAGIGAKQYTAESDRTDSIRASINKAMEDGAETIVCMGRGTGEAVYEFQSKHKKTSFLLLDETPSDADGHEKFKKNTYSVEFNRREAGYLAGYAIVMDGDTALGYLGGSFDQSKTAYGAGFLEGAAAAAEEGKRDKESITVQYGTIPSNAIRPDLASALDAWFQDGCRVLSASGIGPQLIGETAVKKNKAKLVTDELNALEKANEQGVKFGGSGNLLFGAGIDYTNATNTALNKLQSGDLKRGGVTVLGIADDCIRIPMDRAGFTEFSEKAYDHLIQKFKSGELKLSAEVKTDDNGIPEQNEMVQKYIKIVDRTKDFSGESGLFNL